jgi:YggT family protein
MSVASFVSLFIQILCYLLMLVIFLRALVSWFPVNPGSRLIALLYQITEPILAPLRRIIPRIGAIDITPAVAIILLIIIVNLARLLH